MKRMNLSLDAALWEALRMRCLQRHVSASKQVGVLLTQGFQEHAPQEDKSAEAEKRSPLGIHPRGLRGLKPTKAVNPTYVGDALRVGAHCEITAGARKVGEGIIVSMLPVAENAAEVEAGQQVARPLSGRDDRAVRMAYGLRS